MNTKIKLTQHSIPQDTLVKTLNEFPSVSWMATTAVEGITCFEDAIKSGRIKESDYSKFEDEDLTCWRCNGDIHHKKNNGMARKYKAGGKFNDHWECRGKDNKTPVMCAACDLLSDRVYHPNFKLNALYTEECAYQLTKDEDFISFLINPPKPPFVLAMAENNSQHTVWISDFTLDSDLLNIQKSRNQYLVSRSYALSLAYQYQEILVTANTIRELKGNPVELSTPLESSRREINTKTNNNMQISSGIKYLTKFKDDDSDKEKELKIHLDMKIKEIEDSFMTYGDWYVATMYLKALITDFTVKPSNQWQLLAKK